MRYLNLFIVFCFFLISISTGGAARIETRADRVPILNVAAVPLGTDEDSVIYYQTFESGAGGWTVEDLTNPGPKWHRSSFNAFSGQSWWCADPALVGYQNNWLQYLISPPINLMGTSNPTLTFKLYWAVESPSAWGEYDGWDGCNVWVSVTGGNTWQILQPNYPAYTCQSLYSFGWRWEMGSGVPGWAGFSGGWVDASVSLSAYAMANVQLRFAFSSDEATSTPDNPSLIGFFIDNVEVRDGQTLYLSNDGDGNGYPSEFTTGTGDPSGNYWALTEQSSHSPSHSWNCSVHDFLSDALSSPVISIPPAMETAMSYWVFCDMPDADGDNDEYLDDYYYIEVAPLGNMVWTPLVYDWAHNGSQLQWVERSNGYWDGLPTTNIDLTPWAGQSVQVRFRVVTDGNNDGGVGEGLFIDDITLTSSVLPTNDVGTTKLLVPFPTYEDQVSVNCSVDLVNYGTNNQSQVQAFWSVNGVSTALIPPSSIPAGQTITRTFSWTPPSMGLFDFSAYTSLWTDEDSGNDTCVAGQVEVTPSGTFEFGYDHRQLTYMPDFYTFNFAAGNGPMVYFTPAADGVPGILYSESIKAMYYSEGTLNLHIFAAGSSGVPGTEVYTRSETISAGSTFPNWAEIDISDVGYLQGGHPDFWVWLEVTSPDNTPHMTGHLIDSFVPDHFFTYDGTDLNSTIVNFNIRAIMTGTTAVDPEGAFASPLAFSLFPVYPNPFNSMATVTFALPASGQARVSLFDLFGREISILYNQSASAGQYSFHWNAGEMPSGIYWLRLESGISMMTQKIVILK